MKQAGLRFLQGLFKRFKKKKKQGLVESKVKYHMLYQRQVKAGQVDANDGKTEDHGVELSCPLRSLTLHACLSP